MPELGSNNMFCLIKFHHYTYMVEFLHKHKSEKGPNKFEIFEAHQILSWFKEESLDSEKQEYFDLVKKGLLKITEQTQDKAIEAIKEAKSRLEQSASDDQGAQIREYPEACPIQITS